MNYELKDPIHCCPTQNLEFIIQNLFLLLFVLIPAPVSAADLKPETEACFNRYVQATETRIQREINRRGAFLFIAGFKQPGMVRDVAEQVRGGQVYMRPLQTEDASGHQIECPDSLVHHWIGAVFVPGATVDQAIALAQDYDHHQGIYPEVLKSKLLKHDGNDFRIYYRLRKHKVVTVTLNTEHDVQYFRDDANHWHSTSISTRVAQVADAGKPTEHEMPVGHDEGFLWRIDSWWRFEGSEGGVYIECESVSLTRDIPTGLGWLIGPFITSIPKESLRNTLGSTRSALLARIHPQ